MWVPCRVRQSARARADLCRCKEPDQTGARDPPGPDWRRSRLCRAPGASNVFFPRISDSLSMLVGSGALQYARERGLQTYDWWTPLSGPMAAPEAIRKYHGYQSVIAGQPAPASTAPETGDTVGAVAVDARGNMAAAASTGGISLKHPGRVGDTALPGCGFWAVNRRDASSEALGFACSTTGTVAGWRCNVCQAQASS